ncbi:hypothetical protein AB0D63_43365 [Kitasatospora sp. NPDC048343]|uniref:hypothetical protein n=1 Tax=Kitasatospora sp. NPDC048343 TaxID=3154717 RepID=UPI0033CFAD05
MDVHGALADALDRYFQLSLLPVSVTGETDPSKQLHALLAKVGGDTPAGLKAAAAAIGAPVDTVRRWARDQRGIGKAHRSNVARAYQERILEPKRKRAQVRADNKERREAAKRRPGPITDAKVWVKAIIRWTKSPKKKYNAKPYRSTLLDNIDLTQAIEAWGRGKPAGTILERTVAKQYGADEEGGVAFEGNSVQIEINPTKRPT